MGQKCRVCQLLKDRLQIDKALVTGQPISTLSKQYGVSQTSLRNHKERCLSRQILKSQEIRDFFDSQNLIKEISDIIKRTKGLLDQAEKDKKYSAAFSGIGQWRGALEFLTNFAIRLKELELQEQETNEPLNIRVGFVENEFDLKLLDDEELEMFTKLLDKVRGKVVASEGRKRVDQKEYRRLKDRDGDSKPKDVKPKKRHKDDLEEDEPDINNTSYDPDDPNMNEEFYKEPEEKFEKELEKPAGYSGTDREGLSWADRQRPRSRAETAGPTRRDMAKARRKRPRNPLDEMDVPGSVRNSPFKKR